MARVKLKGLTKIIRQTKRLFKNTITSPKLTKQIGEFAVDRIKKSAVTGKSLENNIEAKKLPSLTKFTKDLRKAIKDTDSKVIDDLMRPGKSQVNLTGQLLNSLDYKIKKNKVFIVVVGNRSSLDYKALAKKARQKFGYKDERTQILSFMAYGIEVDDANTNSEVYRDLKKRGFGFIGLDKKGQDRAVQLVLREFRRQIKLKD